MLQRFLEASRSREPLTQWLRERDREDNRRALYLAALILLLTLPIAFMPPTFSGFDQSGGLLRFMLLLSPVLAVILLIVLGSQWKAVTDRPWAEAFLWFFLIDTIGGAGYFHTLSSIQIHGNITAPNPELPTCFARTVIAWTAVAYGAMVLLLTAWGLSGHPRWHSALVAVSGAVVIWDEPIFEGNSKIILWLALCSLLAIAFHRQRYRAGKLAYDQHRSMADALDQRQTFLTSLLPEEALAKVSRNERVADSFSDLTIVFADMVGFTDLSRRTSPGHLVEILNEIFEAADECAQAHGLERVKTVGDCYMAVAGGIRSKGAQATEAVNFAREYVDRVADVGDKHDLPIAVRAGVHTGPAIGGVIGTSRPAYDYWGDAVNRASRLEASSRSGRVLLSETTWLQVRKHIPCESPIEVDMKGIGLVKAYFVADQGAPSADVITISPRSAPLG